MQGSSETLNFPNRGVRRGPSPQCISVAEEYKGTRQGGATLGASCVASPWALGLHIDAVRFALSVGGAGISMAQGYKGRFTIDCTRMGRVKVEKKAAQSDVFLCGERMGLLESVLRRGVIGAVQGWGQGVGAPASLFKRLRLLIH